MIESIARFSARHKRLVIIGWILAVVIFGIISGALKPDWLEGGSLPGAESTKAYELAQKELPEMAEQSGERSGKIVFQADDGLDAHKAEIETYLDDLVANKSKTNVVSVASPFDVENASNISQDKTIAFANVAFDEDVAFNGIGQEAIKDAADLRDDITVEFSGYPFATFEMPASELIGFVAALVILLIAFGSLVAAGLPLFTALVGIAVGTSVVGLWSHLVAVPEVAMNVAMMIAIGVGIDYALFIVTRFREARNRGHNQEDAIVEAMTTAGAAVLFAGITVVISLLGMIIINLNFTTGMAVAASSAVFVMILAAITFVPALLASTLGRHLDKIALPHRKNLSDKPAVWVRWSEFIQRRAWFAAILGAGMLILLAVPLLSLRVGTSDEGNGSTKLTTKRAYDLLAEGFGPGFNGPLFMVVDLRGADAPEKLADVIESIEETDGVAQVFPSSEMLAQQSSGSSDVDVTSNAATDEQQAALDEISQTAANNNAETDQQDQTVVPVQIFPTTSPQAEETTQLVHELRDDVIPPVVQGTGIKTYIGGLTAGNIDFSDFMASRIPWFIGAVLILSFLLLMCVFRSVLVAIKAVIMNLLSIGASYGIIVAIFQWGWAAGLFGVDEKGPIEAWAPMMLFAIVFGLSMDYEVFLLSKIKEEYDDTKDNAGAVTHGLAATARVITAAALIMVCVFGSFVIADDRVLKLMGLGLAIAVLLDATIVRMLLVPATMELLGDKNWWMPKWLDKIIPQIHVERVQAELTKAADEEVLVDA